MQWSRSFEQDSPKIIPNPWGLQRPLRVNNNCTLSCSTDHMVLESFSKIAHAHSYLANALPTYVLFQRARKNCKHIGIGHRWVRHWLPTRKGCLPWKTFPSNKKPPKTAHIRCPGHVLKVEHWVARSHMMVIVRGIRLNKV